ncbi:MAG: peroxiredoxin, partial [Sphingobacteriia bacterium]|nr:peroxiredoxin [Sphingobacteriia bacterium]
MKKMYKSAALLFSALLLASCGNKDNNGGFELKGNFINGKGEMLYLEKLSAEQPVVIDSVALDENGDFEFQNYSPKIG